MCLHDYCHKGRTRLPLFCLEQPYPATQIRVLRFASCMASHNLENEMASARNFMTAASGLSDPELMDMIRMSMLENPDEERLHWLKQVELSLDGYGGERHFSSAERICAMLRLLEEEVRGETAIMIAN